MFGMKGADSPLLAKLVETLMLGIRTFIVFTIAGKQVEEERG